ncbi:MAG: hypothetical protein ACF8XB_01385 [Planctomycetota bacterium JB042]
MTRRSPEELLDALERRLRDRRRRTVERLREDAGVLASPRRWTLARPLASCGAVFAGAALLARGDGGSAVSRRGDAREDRTRDDAASPDDEASTGAWSALLALGARAATTWLVQRVSDVAEDPDVADSAPAGDPPPFAPGD